MDTKSNIKHYLVIHVVTEETAVVRRQAAVKRCTRSRLRFDVTETEFNSRLREKSERESIFEGLSAYTSLAHGNVLQLDFMVDEDVLVERFRYDEKTKKVVCDNLRLERQR